MSTPWVAEPRIVRTEAEMLALVPQGTTFDHYDEESENRTRQQDADSADINKVIAKYNLQPFELEVGWSGKVGEFLDLASVPTFQGAMERIAKADAYFMQLPPNVREGFKNSVAYMMDCWNEGREPELFEEIGILQRKVAERPVRVEVVPAPAPE